MEIVVKEGKNLEDILEEVKNELDLPIEDILYKTSTKKGGLFKGEVTVVKAISVKAVGDFIKEFLAEILKNMGLEVTFESRIRDNQITIKMYSDKNYILIGKNGQTLQALQTIIRQSVYNQIEIYPYIILDVENYKDKQIKHLERLAKNIAREVAYSGIEAKLDSMNSYERRIIHSVLSEHKKVVTESAGEEPNRYVVIKKKED